MLGSAAVKIFRGTEAIVGAGRQSPYILCLGGTLRPHSSTGLALRVAADAVKRVGARAEVLTGSDLELPLFTTERAFRDPAAQILVQKLRQSDGIIIASPGYHGGLSGLVKNALDYVEDMRGDDRPYFDGRAVGCISGAAGWQAAATTLVSLRSVVHALRGWPTPLGVCINTSNVSFDESGACIDPSVQANIEIMAGQVVDFACRARSGLGPPELLDAC
jgi:FMN reductase